MLNGFHIFVENIQQGEFVELSSMISCKQKVFCKMMAL